MQFNVRRCEELQDKRTRWRVLETANAPTWLSIRCARAENYRSCIKRPQRCGAQLGSLVLTINSDACSWEAKRARYFAPGICNFGPGAFLKLYKRAHSEMTVDKSSNSPKSDIHCGGRNVRFTPESGHERSRTARQLRATRRLMHCSKLGGFLRGRGTCLTHLRHAAERTFYFRPGSRCARWLIRHAAMLRAVRQTLHAIGAAKERLCVGAFDRPAAVMFLEHVRLHAGCLVFGLEVGDAAAGFDVRHTASSAFKGVKVGQVAKSRRYSSEPHDLSAAWAIRRLWALVAHGHWSFRS
jgi:hypothetical protein